jgi:hypothetical protein
MYRLGTFLAVTFAFISFALGEPPTPLRVMTFNIRNLKRQGWHKSLGASKGTLRENSKGFRS